MEIWLLSIVISLQAGVMSIVNENFSSVNVFLSRSSAVCSRFMFVHRDMLSIVWAGWDDCRKASTTFFSLRIPLHIIV